MRCLNPSKNAEPQKPNFSFSVDVFPSVGPPHVWRHGHDLDRVYLATWHMVDKMLLWLVVERPIRETCSSNGMIFAGRGGFNKICWRPPPSFVG